MLVLLVLLPPLLLPLEDEPPLEDVGRDAGSCLRLQGMLQLFQEIESAYVFQISRERVGASRRRA